MSCDSEAEPIQPGSLAAILPAAGRGQRFGDRHNKLFAMLAGQPVWVHSVAALRARPEVGRILMAVSAADRPMFAETFANLVAAWGVELVAGGRERTDSVAAALAALADDASVAWVGVHDAARPLVRDTDLANVFAAAARSGAALLATPVTATLKRGVENVGGCVTVDRRDLWLALTPQVFQVALLRRAYQQHNGRPATDDAELVERSGQAVTLVRGAADNLKITYPEDLAVAEAMLAQRSNHA